MQSRAEWLREVDLLLTGTDYDRFARSKYMNVAATAFILGTNTGQVRQIMRGYPKYPAGNSRLYDKADIFEAIRHIAVCS